MVRVLRQGAGLPRRAAPGRDRPGAAARRRVDGRPGAGRRQARAAWAAPRPAREGRNLDHFCFRVEPLRRGGHPRATWPRCGVAAGPVESRYGAEGEGPSIYLHDPEGNTIELKGPPSRERRTRGDALPCRRRPPRYGKPPAGWRRRLYNIIFEADTPAGRRFDIALVFAILLSILVVVLDSVPRHARRPRRSHATRSNGASRCSSRVEYLARLVCVQRPLRYATSFFGIIDLLSVLPTYFSLLVPGSALLLDIRILRLLRVFRIFKLTLYIDEYTRLGEALRASRRKIMVFLSVVLMAILILGTADVRGRGAGATATPASRWRCTGPP